MDGSLVGWLTLWLVGLLDGCVGLGCVGLVGWLVNWWVGGWVG